MRTVPTWLLVVLALGCGAVAGAALDEYFSLRGYRFEWQRRARRALNYHPRQTDPRQFTVDSARAAAAARRFQSYWHPREIGRAQVLSHCAVAFEIRDTFYQRSQLFEARAWDWSNTGTEIAQGYTYKPTGSRRGDTVEVVLPNVWCPDLRIGGFGASLVDRSPPPQRQLDVR